MLLPKVVKRGIKHSPDDHHLHSMIKSQRKTNVTASPMRSNNSPREHLTVSNQHSQLVKVESGRHSKQSIH